jgi:hypothetical protein
VDGYGGLLTYTGGWLDRAGGRRADPGWLDELLNRPDATLIPFWRDQCLVPGDLPVPVRLYAARADGVVFPKIEPAVIMTVQTECEPTRILRTGVKDSPHRAEGGRHVRHVEDH